MCCHAKCHLNRLHLMTKREFDCGCFGATGADVQNKKGSVPRCCTAHYHSRHTRLEKLSDVELHMQTRWCNQETATSLAWLKNVKYKSWIILFIEC